MPLGLPPRSRQDHQRVDARSLLGLRRVDSGRCRRELGRRVARDPRDVESARRNAVWCAAGASARADPGGGVGGSVRCIGVAAADASGCAAPAAGDWK